MGDSEKPRRLRWSVPAVDTSTNQWLDIQENISRSIQLLIRESILRDGYIDVVNRPVDQLPRRDRPPQTETAGNQMVTDAGDGADADKAQITDAGDDRAEAPAPALRPEPDPAVEPHATERPMNPDVAAGITDMLNMR